MAASVEIVSFKFAALQPAKYACTVGIRSIAKKLQLE